jgi:phosphatidylserine/phosphatidylglycerophosphate/cardiolipin synthase-like enzyme
VQASTRAAGWQRTPDASKVIIIDGEIVITGSYNFSNNAEYNNDENTLIIHNRDIATQFLDNFQRIYDMSQR